ncbi:tRNA (adenosine(37)-N6)-threonylcarbamoyltransferase complex ATPase subunit type 1 TsaE [Aureivirga sp. CE67]|uniref:tRNA (adenosine(37)-N6)-threonylcarbamoyltransferase complex ATPase subunit type 1 TsaE n=1 Tax=Aureivirga sp. CE67 TaxID=1788983 RepID=UPI0018CB22D9|nr:tRNA (adenosine(37)-N6)-threonylcarbamoyltransferase complex ATPase subunit type 1 TsaE [Aureivirga sp. CE67]
MKIDYTLENLPEVADFVLKNTSNKVLLFYGEMGAGKTTLIKELAKKIGVNDLTNSPTFSLVNEYHSNKGEIIYHFDFYRIEEEEEAYDIGVEEYFDSNAWSFVEWPQNIENLLPLSAVKLKITVKSATERTLEIKS